MKKKILISAIILAIAPLCLFFCFQAEGSVQPYYSGEAVSFNNHIYFGSINSGSFELFEFKNGNIDRLVNFASDEVNYSRFNDLIFNEEQGRLFVYLINGKYLYKYDIAYPNNLTLVKKVSDNSRDEFYGLTNAGYNVATIGTKGIKVWNSDLSVINTFSKSPKNGKNVTFSDDGNYYAMEDKGKIRLNDSFYHDIVFEKYLSNNDEHFRHSYIDENNGDVYIVDDENLNKFNIEGNSEYFDHTGDSGYDVDATEGKSYVYFSDGIGIVKIRKSDMHPIDWAYTKNMGAGNGWTIGLRAVENSSGEYIIAFNGSSILIFNSSLNLLDSYNARERQSIGKEKLSLKLDQNFAYPDGMVTLYGKGYGFNENVEIKYLNTRSVVSADKYGNFEKTIEFYDQKPGSFDIKATGLTSKDSYSISMQVLKY